MSSTARWQAGARLLPAALACVRDGSFHARAAFICRIITCRVCIGVSYPRAGDRTLIATDERATSPAFRNFPLDGSGGRVRRVYGKSSLSPLSTNGPPLPPPIGRLSLWRCTD